MRCAKTISRSTTSTHTKFVVCVTWYVACVNGTRRGLRMTLSGKCSGLCIVISRVNIVGAGYCGTHTAILCPSQTVKPSSKPISYFPYFFAASLSRARWSARDPVPSSGALFRPGCSRDSGPHSSIKSNNIPMNAPRLLLAMHLHKRRSNYFTKRDYDVPDWMTRRVARLRIIAVRFYNTRDPRYYNHRL